MLAKDEVENLLEKIASGDMPEDEPIFVLRARDLTAVEWVRCWAQNAYAHGTPTAKLQEARELADKMERWPVKQIPGRPETRQDHRHQNTDPIPEGISYNTDTDNFYLDSTHAGMGNAFYHKWSLRRSEFPQRNLN